MTALDKWEPRGIPIHPYDVYDLVCEHGLPLELDRSPKCEDEDDYRRNTAKLGTIIELNGVVYRETTHVPYKSTSFADFPYPDEPAKIEHKWGV